MAGGATGQTADGERPEGHASAGDEDDAAEIGADVQGGSGPARTGDAGAGDG